MSNSITIGTPTAGTDPGTISKSISVQIVNPETNTVIASGVGVSAGDLINQITKQQTGDKRTAAELVAQLTQKQTELAALNPAENRYAQKKANLDTEISVINKKITSNNSDIAAADEALVYANSEYQTAIDQRVQDATQKEKEVAAASTAAEAATPDTAVVADPKQLTKKEEENLNKPAAAETTVAAAAQPTVAPTPSPKTDDPTPTASDTAKSPAAATDSAAAPSSNQAVNADKNKKYAAIPNPLDDYANYTYGMSLHIIPIDTYRKIVNDREYQYTGSGNVLIASAGRRGENFKRNANFTQDFYFENLKFTTVIGMNARSRSTNALDVNFTIVEPYGMTLLNRLLAVADAIGGKNWGEMPFMLEIDFYGNNDDGTLITPIAGHTKYIPIKIIDCKIKVSTRGAEYQISAIPYSQAAFLEHVASTPVFLEVQAKTIGDFFSSDGNAGDATTIVSDSARAASDAAHKAEVAAFLAAGVAGAARQGTKTVDSRKATPAAAPKKYKVSSYAAAMNSYQTQLATSAGGAGGKPYQQFADQYTFVFDPEISAMNILEPQKNTVGNSAATPADSATVAAGIDTNTQVFNINAGTSLIEVINMVMRNSSFARGQLKEDGDKTKTNQPIDWYKITPEITLGEFDTIRQSYQRLITYNINKFAFYNTVYPKAEKSLPNSWAKQYFYMFTGKNQAILDFSIDFNIMFYTSMTVDRDKIQKVAVSPAAEPATKDDTGAATPTSTGSTIAPLAIRNVAGTQAGAGGVAGQSIANASANDLAKSIMSHPRGDMINVKLKIAGDPGFIKQDDVYYGASKAPSFSASGILDKTNSLITDAGEIFVLIEFRTPSDIDPDTGLMDFSSWSTSVFSGLYRVITVENVFDRGQFYQNLDLIRLMDQPAYDSVVSTPATTTQRDTATTNVTSKSAATVTATDKSSMAAAKIVPASITPIEAELQTGVTDTVAATPPLELEPMKELRAVVDKPETTTVVATEAELPIAIMPDPSAALRAQVAAADAARVAASDLVGPATDAAQQAYDIMTLFDPEGKNFSASFTGSLNGRTFTDPYELYAAAQIDFQQKAAKRKELAIDFNSKLAAYTELKAQLDALPPAPKQ